MAECKYYKQVRQVSYDSGVTWISLDEYQKGDLYETDSPDCGGGITQYKWVNVSGEHTCVGTTKYQKTKKQQSTDGGRTWTDVNPPEYSTGAVIETDSSDCGGSCSPFLEYCCGRGSHSDCDIQLESTSGSRVWDTMYICGESDVGREVYVTNNLPSWLEVRVDRYDVGFETLEENINDARYFTVELESNHSRWQQQCTEGSLNSYCTTASVVVKQLGGMLNLKFKATYNNGQSYSKECDGNSALTSGETRPNGYVYTGITSVAIGNCVTTITNGSFDTGVFANCYSLTSVTIPNSVTRIGNSAFYECSGLTRIDIPDSVKSIGVLAFYRCSGLRRVNSNIYGVLNIPSGVTSIESQAFDWCTGFTSINIPNTVTSISHYAFGSTNIRNITIPSSVTSLGWNPFGWCTSLTSITVDSANSYYSSLDGVLFNKSKTLLISFPCGRSGSYAIPNGVTVIGVCAFDLCENLTSISIPNTVTTLSAGCLSDCDGFTSITLPSSVTFIDSGAFQGCSNLTSLTCLATTPPEMVEYALQNTPIQKGRGYIYVPSGSVNAYKSASGWSEYSSRIQAIS